MIKNIIFDVGMVLIDFRWYNYMIDLGFAPEVCDELGEKMVMSDFWHELDRGSVSEDDAPDYFKGIMPQYANEIDKFWANMMDIVEEFDYAKPMIKALKAAGYNVYLLSNYPGKMGDLHWPTFTFMEYLDGAIMSAKEKKVKPEKDIYELILSRYSLKAEECIFLDDKEENVITARELGINAIKFTSYDAAVEELKEYGVAF